MTLILAALLSFTLSVTLTPLVRSAAIRTGSVAAPRGDRWHKRPTALLGGVGIFVAFTASYAVFQGGLEPALPIVGAAMFLFVVGLVDDLRDIAPLAKLWAQLIAAATVVHFGWRLPWTQNVIVNDLITLLWLVGITNAINLLDNMDGLASGIAVIASAFLCVALVLDGQSTLALVPALLGGSALGFLVFNFKPASIFMGDCGSMFLGFALGGIALLSQYGRSRNLGAVVLTPVLILMIPILDTTLVTVTRKLKGRPVSQGGRDHTSHRLVALGASERRAVVTLYFLAAGCGLFALAVRWLQLSALTLMLPCFALLVVLFALYLGTVHIDEERRDAVPSVPVGQRQRAVELIVDVVLIFVAYYGAYLLAFDFDFSPQQGSVLARTMPLVLLVELGAFYVGGVYRELWRYARVEDLLTIARSVVAGAAVSGSIVLAMFPVSGSSATVLVLNGVLLLILATASRLAVRLLDYAVRSPRAVAHDSVPVLIYGAGAGSALLAQEMLDNPGYRRTPIGFIADDAGTQGRRVQGLRIFGREELLTVMEQHGVNEVLVPGAHGDDEQVEALRSLGISPRRMSLRFDP